jgi:hypothetical protein
MNAKHIIGVLDLNVEHALYRDNGYWDHPARVSIEC